MKYYSIIVEPEAQGGLESIYRYIALNDTEAKVQNFLHELKVQISTLDTMPFRYRKSYYTDIADTYDLIYKGYTIVYKVIESTVHIFDNIPTKELLNNIALASP